MRSWARGGRRRGCGVGRSPHRLTESQGREARAMTKRACVCHDLRDALDFAENDAAYSQRELSSAQSKIKELEHRAEVLQLARDGYRASAANSEKQVASLGKMLDELNEKSGNNSFYYANMLETKDMEIDEHVKRSNDLANMLKTKDMEIEEHVRRSNDLANRVKKMEFIYKAMFNGCIQAAKKFPNAFVRDGNGVLVVDELVDVGEIVECVAENVKARDVATEDTTQTTSFDDVTADDLTADIDADDLTADIDADDVEGNSWGAWDS